MPDIPIVLFHKSEHYYVSYALRAAKKYNKTVVLLTDVDVKIYRDSAIIENLNTYSSEAVKKLAGLYRHFSTNPYQFELTSIERYFYLLEYMQKNRVEKMLYIDSDILLYENMTVLSERYFKDHDLCYGMPQQEHEDLFWSASGHISLWTIGAMEKFCAFILDTYENNTAMFSPKWTWHQQNNIPGGINDMTLIYLFQRSSQLKTGSFLTIFDDAYTFDNSMQSSMNEFPGEYKMKHSFLLDKDIKDIRFTGGVPQCYNQRLHKKIFFYALHFQGDCKKLMLLYTPYRKNFREYISLAGGIMRLVYARLKSFFES